MEGSGFRAAAVRSVVTGLTTQTYFPARRAAPWAQIRYAPRFTRSGVKCCHEETHARRVEGACRERPHAAARHVPAAPPTMMRIFSTGRGARSGRISPHIIDAFDLLIEETQSVPRLWLEAQDYWCLCEFRSHRALRGSMLCGGNGVATSVNREAAIPIFLQQGKRVRNCLRIARNGRQLLAFLDRRRRLRFAFLAAHDRRDELECGSGLGGCEMNHAG